MTLYAVPGLLLVSIAMFFVGLARIIVSQGEEIDDRLERYAGVDPDYAFLSGDENIKMVGEAEDETGNPILAWLKRRGEKDESGTVKLRDELARADLKLKTYEWQFINLLAVVAAFGLGILIFQNIILSPLTAILGLFVPRFYLRYRQRKRLNAFDGMLSDGIAMMATSLRAGNSFLQSMEETGREMPDPMASEFNRVVQEIGLGLSQQAALNNCLRRIPSEDLDMMITAVNIQQEVGGNLAEILDTLAHTIRERNRIQGEIQVLVAQQRLAGIIITLLPVALAAILFLINHDYMANLYKTQCGWIMIGTSIFMIILGYMAIQKIVNIEV